MSGWRIWMVVLLSGLLVGCGENASNSGPQYTQRGAAEHGQQIYRLAVHPLHNPQKLYEAYQPLADYLSRRVPGVQFEVEASNSYAHYEEKLKARTPAFALPNPYQSLKALDWGYRVLAEAGNSQDFKGLIIARKDSAIRAPADLRGEVIAYPAPTALAAAMLPQYWLAGQGLKVMQDVESRYVGSQDSSILSAYHQQSAVSATWPPPWRAFQKSHPREAQAMQVLWETPPLINNAVMVRDDIPAELAERVRLILMHLHEDPEGIVILENMQTARFNPADDARYRQTVGSFLAQFQKSVGPLP